MAAAPKVDLNSMELADKVRWFYEHGSGSIQDIARIHRLTVDEVLHMIGQDEMTTVTLTGDMVDQQEAGPGVQLNHGSQHFVPYSTD